MNYKFIELQKTSDSSTIHPYVPLENIFLFQKNDVSYTAGNLNEKLHQKIDNLPNYPVGTVLPFFSIHGQEINPSEYMPGVWERVAGDSAISVVGPYGEKLDAKFSSGTWTHVLTMAETPPHYHKLITHGHQYSASGSGWNYGQGGTTSGDGLRWLQKVGGGAGHSNTQPTIGAAFWRKVSE